MSQVLARTCDRRTVISDPLGVSRVRHNPLIVYSAQNENHTVRKFSACNDLFKLVTDSDILVNVHFSKIILTRIARYLCQNNFS